MLGTRIRHYREKAKLTQEELGANINKDSSVISKIESGNRRVAVSEIKAIADALGVSLIELLDEDEKENTGTDN